MPSKHTLKPGYAFRCAEQGFDYTDIPNDWWEIVMVSKAVCGRAQHVGSLVIDGTDPLTCAVFVDDYNGTHYAQTEVYTRDAR